MPFGYVATGAAEAVADKEQSNDRPARRGRELETQTKQHSEGLRNQGKCRYCSRQGTAASRDNFMDAGRERPLLGGQGRRMS